MTEILICANCRKLMIQSVAVCDIIIIGIDYNIYCKHILKLISSISSNTTDISTLI